MTEREIKKTIVVDAIPQIVFRALTDENELPNWFPNAGAKVDLKVGGIIELKTRRPDTGEVNTVKGKITRLVPDQQFSYTWSSEAYGGQSAVTWSLEPLENDKTRVTLTHSGIVSDETRFAEADRGWSYFTDRLAKYCSRAAGPS